MHILVETDHDNIMIRYFFKKHIVIIFFFLINYTNFSWANSSDLSNSQSPSNQPMSWDAIKFEHWNPFVQRLSDQTSVGLFGGAIGSVLLSATQDDYVRADSMNHQYMDSQTSHWGDLIGTGAASVLVMGGQYLWDTNESHYQSHLRGFIYGGISIYTLKTVFNRQRPGNSRSYQSFPSGHTAITFMTATQLAYAYDWPVGVAAFAVAAFTGASRLADDVHWFSDTVGGAFLGILVGRAAFFQSNGASQVVLQTSTDAVKWSLFPVLNHESVAGVVNIQY